MMPMPQLGQYFMPDQNAAGLIPPEQQGMPPQADAEVDPDQQQIISQAIRPPQNPQEEQELRTGWQGFVQGLRNNPEMAQALILMGQALMRPGSPGENFANASKEIIMLMRQNQADRERRAREGRRDARADRALDLQEKGTNAQIRSADAAQALAERRTDIDVAKFNSSLEMDMLKLQQNSKQWNAMFGLRSQEVGLAAAREQRAATMDEVQKKYTEAMTANATGIKIDGGGLVGSVVEVLANDLRKGNTDLKPSEAVKQATQQVMSDPSMVNLVNSLGEKGNEQEKAVLAVTSNLYKSLMPNTVAELGTDGIVNMAKDIVSKVYATEETPAGAPTSTTTGGATPQGFPQLPPGEVPIKKRAAQNGQTEWLIKKPDGTTYTKVM